MATTYTTLPLDGTTREFTIPFEYLTRRFVTATLIGATRKTLVLNVDFRFVTPTKISTTVTWGPADGYDTIELRRNTSSTDRLVDFNDGSILRASDLNISQVQAIHIAEEGRDISSQSMLNNLLSWNALNLRIRNLGEPVNPQDAATKNYVDNKSNSDNSLMESRVLSTIRGAAGESIKEIPSPSERSLKILGFDGLGNPIVTAPVGGSATELSLNLGDAAQGGRLIGFASQNTGATYQTVQDRLNQKVTIFDLVPKAQWAAIKNGTTTYDATADIAKGVSWGVGEIDFGDMNNVIRMDGTVTLTKGIHLKGEATIKAPISARAFVFAPGFDLQMPIVAIGALANYPAFGGNAVTPLIVEDASQLRRGDVVMISSEDIYTFAPSARKAELIRVLEVSGTTVYLHGFLGDTYTTNKKLTRLKRDKLLVDKLKFTSQGDPFSLTTGAGNGVIRLQGAVNADIKASFHNLGSTALNLTSCWNTSADIRVEDLRDKLSISSFGYGVIAYGATRHSRLKINAQRVRHAYTGGVIDAFQHIFDYGTARDNTIYDSLALNTTAASFDTHPGEFNAEFRDCRSVFRNGDSDSTTSQAPGYQDRGCNTRFINCGVEGVGAGWELIGASTLHGTPNTTELIGCWTITRDRMVSPAVITIRPKVAPEACVVNIFDTRFNGGELGATISMFDGAPDVNFYNVQFTNISNLRLAGNNKIRMIGCTRIQPAGTMEPIIVGAGSSLTIDRYLADAPAYSANHLVRAGLSSDAGSSVVNLGSLSAVGRDTSAHPVGTNGFSTLTINRIDAFPQRARRSNTAGRPTLTASDIGYLYFDTTISKPIWWSSVGWVDGAGVSV